MQLFLQLIALIMAAKMIYDGLPQGLVFLGASVIFGICFTVSDCQARYVARLNDIMTKDMPYIFNKIKEDMNNEVVEHNCDKCQQNN